MEGHGLIQGEWNRAREGGGGGGGVTKKESNELRRDMPNHCNTTHFLSALIRRDAL